MISTEMEKRKVEEVETESTQELGTGRTEEKVAEEVDREKVR